MAIFRTRANGRVRVRSMNWTRWGRPNRIVLVLVCFFSSNADVTYFLLNREHCIHSAIVAVDCVNPFSGRMMIRVRNLGSHEPTDGPKPGRRAVTGSHVITRSRISFRGGGPRSRRAPSQFPRIVVFFFTPFKGVGARATRLHKREVFPPTSCNKETLWKNSLLDRWSFPMQRSNLFILFRCVLFWSIVIFFFRFRSYLNHHDRYRDLLYFFASSNALMERLKRSCSPKRSASSPLVCGTSRTPCWWLPDPLTCFGTPL